MILRPAIAGSLSSFCNPSMLNPTFTIVATDEYGASYSVGHLYSLAECRELLSDLKDAEDNCSSYTRRCLIAELETFIESY